MARILNLSPRRRNILLIFFALALIILFPFSEYLQLHRLIAHRSGDHFPSDTVRHPNSTRILIVSSMFILPKAKHSMIEYNIWLKRFLGPVTNEIYFYTSPDFAATIQSLRGEGLPLIIDTNYTTQFDVPPLQGLEGAYKEMHGQDREKSYHSPELYSAWSAKPFFVDNAIRVMEKEGKTYDYVFWNDGGSFRENNVYKNWPDPTRVYEVWQEGSELSGTKVEDLLFFPIQFPPRKKDWTEDMGPIDTDFSEGSFFGGSPSTMAWWARTYYAYHDYYLSKSIFVGKDQTLFNAILVLFNERVITVWARDPDAPAAIGGPKFLGECGREWHYYQFWLSDPQTREEMRKLWSTENKDKVEKMEDCRVTGVLALNVLLKRMFGEEWKTPVSTVDTPVLSWQH